MSILIFVQRIHVSELYTFLEAPLPVYMGIKILDLCVHTKSVMNLTVYVRMWGVYTVLSWVYMHELTSVKNSDVEWLKKSLAHVEDGYGVLSSLTGGDADLVAILSGTQFPAQLSAGRGADFNC